MDEDRAVELCQQGDREAFRFIVERYGDTLYGTAFLMTRDHQAAEDMTQTALLLAWKSIPQFEAGTHLKAWLVRILVNQVISERRRKKLPQMPLEAAPDSPGEAAGGLEAVLAVERQEEVRAALGTLDDSVRQAIVLRYFAEMSVPEIASALGWAEGTVKSRIHRGLAKMKEHFTETAPAVAVPLREC